MQRNSPDSAQGTPSPGSSEASITQAATEDILQDLPDLIHSESMSLSSTDQVLSMGRNVCAEVLHRKSYIESLNGLKKDLESQKTTDIM